MAGFIYLITNLINGKYYVGKTKSTIAARWTGHKSQIARGRKSVLASAVRKYGVENFVIEQLATSDDLDNLERLWIVALNSTDRNVGYNMTFGGDGGSPVNKRKGWKHSEETKKKLSESRKGTLSPAQEAHLLEMTQKNVGSKRSDETKEKHRLSKLGPKNPQFGQIRSEEWKRNQAVKISLAAARRHRNENGCFV